MSSSVLIYLFPKMNQFKIKLFVYLSRTIPSTAVILYVILGLECAARNLV